MKHFRDCLTFAQFTMVPVITCWLLLLLFPAMPASTLLLIGCGAAMLTSWLLACRLRRETAAYSQCMNALQENLAGGSALVQLPESGIRFLASQNQAFENLSASLTQRLQTLLASNDELARNYTRFQMILSTMTDGVLLISAEGQVLYCNRSAGQLLGRQASLVEGKTLWEVVRTPNLEASIELALASGEELRQELDLVRTNSIVEMSAVQLDVYSGAGMLIVLHDVSELRRLERMRREFVSNVSHELKTPLTAMQAYADTLLEGGLEDTENSRRFVERIQEQGERLQQMIQDMLRLARIESQADAFQLQPVSLTKTVESCVDARSAVARARNVSLHCHCDDQETIKVIADQEGLRTIFDNLINNALNYTPENGDVEVRCWKAGGEALIEIEDNGIGISAEHHARIFERFYRVDQARSRSLGGTGLGLAIVKHCTNVFGGSIEIDSEVGRGTTFRVRFPTVEEPVASIY